ncbi:MAG TPA: hypothetical protein VFW23_17730 [Tepidisphaeraceae bacterium]|nr:hypothetical protein [Tepidisphaeraceae bacterium]
MAIWQFKIEVVPSERVRDRAEITEAEFDDAGWWSDRQPPSDFSQQLAAMLPPTKSWSEKLLWFGKNDGDRFDVWMENDRMHSFQVRLDCQRPNHPLMDGLLRIAGDWSCSFIELRYLQVLPLNRSDFINAIAMSPSNRFMENPALWLPKLAAEVKERERRKVSDEGDASNP